MFLWVAQGCLGRLEGQTCCKSLSAFIALGDFLRRYEHQCAAVFLGISKAAIFSEVKSPMCDVGQAATRTFLHVTVIWTRTPCTPVRTFFGGAVVTSTANMAMIGN